MIYIICVLIGIMSAIVGGLLGIGGGIILIPTMLFLHDGFEMFDWVTPQTIVGISLITMVFTALSSSIAHHKAKRIDYKTGALFIIGSIPGSILGSAVNHFLHGDSFSLYLGFLMIVLFGFFFIERKTPENQMEENRSKNVRVFKLEGKTHYYNVPVWLALLLSFGVSMISGLFGIGGGSIMVPSMILLFNMPVHIATATSMFTIFFISLFGTSTHFVLGHIVWKYAIFFIPGAWIGGTIGAKINQLLKGNMLEWLLRILLVVLGLQLIFT